MFYPFLTMHHQETSWLEHVIRAGCRNMLCFEIQSLRFCCQGDLRKQTNQNDQETLYPNVGGLGLAIN